LALVLLATILSATSPPKRRVAPAHLRYLVLTHDHIQKALQFWKQAQRDGGVRHRAAEFGA
jgi:hypothetical protein